MAECEFMDQDISRTGRAKVCVVHSRERIYCQVESLRKTLVEKDKKIASAEAAIEGMRKRYALMQNGVRDFCKDFEKMKATVVSWDALVKYPISGDITLPGAKTENKETKDHE